jgi:hypothetical protein
VAMPQRRRERLARESNLFGEQAALLHLDGHHERALAAAYRAVEAQEALYKGLPDDDEVGRVYANRRRDRAEIRREWGIELEGGGSIASAIEQYRLGVSDAKHAIDAYERTDPTSADHDPLWVPTMRLLLAELLGWSGSHDQARKVADGAIAVLRASREPTDEGSTLAFAYGLARYAYLLAFIGDDPGALVARRESVDLTRPWLRREGKLWSWRHSRGTTWITTPTLERFCRTAYYLALDLEPPNALAAPEALLALQDAAEGFADLVPTSLVVVSEEVRDIVSCLGDTTFAIERWLDFLGEPDLARRYAETFRGIHEIRGEWSAPIRALRAQLTAIVARYQP